MFAVLFLFFGLLAAVYGSDGALSSPTNSQPRYGLTPQSSSSGRRVVDVRYQVIKDFSHGYFESASNVHCGVFLIAPNIVLTAAHCGLPESLMFRVVPGVKAFQANVLKITKKNGFALVSVEPNANVPLVALLEKDEFIKDGTIGSVFDWANERTIVSVVNRNLCQKGLPSGTICVESVQGDVDLCQLESGSPFVVKGKLVGIPTGKSGCVYSEVAAVRDWIKMAAGV